VGDLCAFCPRFAIPSGKWAVTAQARDGSWRREVLPLCPRCDRLLREAGDAGRVLKATGERWFGGHKVGIFEAKGKPRPY
jgi:uncharacterized C2H2 Zn-finger protein